MSRWSDLRADFTLRRLPLTVGTGVVLAMVNALLGIALVSLIFGGPLRDYLTIGIGIGLIGSAVVALVVALGSRLPGMYAGIQDASSAIIGLSATSVAAALAAPQALDTVLAMVAVTSFATGLTFLAMGYFRLGEIARFVPFPVIGGLLAGTGYLIVTGSLGVLGVNSFQDLTTTAALGLAWPALALAVLFVMAARAGWPTWVYLALMGAAVSIFYAAIWLTDIDRVRALEWGWLLESLPDSDFWPGAVTQALGSADWGAIAGEAAGLASILLIVPITVLLYLSAIELETRRDIDINAELRTTGWANVASAALGGAPGYTYVADTVMTHRLVGARRGSAIVAAVSTLIVLIFAGAIIGFLPQFVIGAILLFYGFEFLIEWLWSSRRRMSRLDYALMWGIVVIIATVGFLQGVAAGLVAAILLFVVRYSRIDVVKHSLTAREHQSNIERSTADAELIRANGEVVLILELQGFIFFGTAGRVINRLRDHITAVSDLEYVIFDFRLVTGVDSSAVVLFERIALLARDHGLTLIMTGLSPTHESQFSDLLSGYGDVVRVEPDLDRGMAWSEGRILDEGDREGPGRAAIPPDLETELAPYLVSRTVAAGTELMRQGDPAPGIFLIRQGQATVLLDGGDGTGRRLRTLLPGTVLGEISLYRGEPVTATVVAETDCEILHLTPDAFERLCRTDPVTAAHFHRFVARTLAGRVSHANRAIRALHG